MSKTMKLDINNLTAFWYAYDIAWTLADYILDPFSQLNGSDIDG